MEKIFATIAITVAILATATLGFEEIGDTFRLQAAKEANRSAEYGAMRSTLPPQWQDVVYIMEYGNESKNYLLERTIEDRKYDLCWHKLSREQAHFIASIAPLTADAYRDLLPYIKE